MPMKRILVIDNYDSFVFNIVQLLRELPEEVKFDVVRNDAIDLKHLSEYDGIILSPGPGVPAEAGELRSLIGTCKYTHPLLGVCLGHQAIAESFGATLFNMPVPLHGHRTVLQITDPGDPLFVSLPTPAIVGRYHSWTVSSYDFPSDLVISSLDEEGHIMSFYHRTLPICGVQFHPESYISNCGRQIMTNWIHLLPSR